MQWNQIRILQLNLKARDAQWASPDRKRKFTLCILYLWDRQSIPSIERLITYNHIVQMTQRLNQTESHLYKKWISLETKPARNVAIKPDRQGILQRSKINDQLWVWRRSSRHQNRKKRLEKGLNLSGMRRGRVSEREEGRRGECSHRRGDGGAWKTTASHHQRMYWCEEENRASEVAETLTLRSVERRALMGWNVPLFPENYKYVSFLDYQVW